MKAVVLVLLVAAASGQLSSTRDEDCKANESFQTCGSACEPSCNSPNPSFCTLQCVVGCQCDKDFFRRSDNACVKKEECNAVTNATAPVAPILPAPVNMTCGANEEHNTCHSPCGEAKCPDPNAPLVNCITMCIEGCSCKAGYVRNNKGVCVKEADCPVIAPTENQCNLVDCRSGTKCVIQNNAPICIPVLTCATVLCQPGKTCRMIDGRPKCLPVEEEPPVGITCANVRCGSKGGCGMVEPTGCPGCKLQPHCLEVNNCNTANCSSTEECVLVQVTCVMAPCHPIAECRPKKNIKPLVQIREPRQTGPSCMTARCATPAGCAMIKPMSCLHDKNCQLQPACIHENACAATSCLVGTECVLHEVQCIRAPCNPIAQCEPIKGDKRCKKANETWTQCKTACSDTQCNQEPRMCAQVCRAGGCVCQPGFFRDKAGKCVTQNDCDAQKDYSDTPAPPLSDNSTSELMQCATVRCMSGTECQVLTRNCTTPPCETYPSCVNVTSTGGCDTMRCQAGETCQEAMVKCAAPPCPRHAMCMANSSNETLSGCASMTCMVGQTCQEAMVKCAVPPCPSHATCVDSSETSSNDTLNSCASVTCPVGERCEETTVQCFVAPCPKAVSCVPMNSHQNSTARQGCDVVRCRANEICEEQEVQCLMAPCPIQVACVSIVHTNGTNSSTVTSTPGNTCPTNQTMSDCLNTCSEAKCPGSGTGMMCTKHCGHGCACAAGFVRSNDGECYKPKDCPPEQICGQNEEYRCEKCAGTCKNPEPNCPGPKNKNCNKKCICAAGFVKKNGKCVTLASCPDHDHSNITCLGTQDFTDCLPKCRQLCSGSQECDKNMHTETCTPGCVCRANYKLDSNGTCVHNRHCFKTTDCPDNEEWSKCVSDDVLCAQATILKVPMRDSCFSGCTCSAGFARNSNGTCVEQDKCW